MDDEVEKRLLAALLSRQRETGAAAALPLERLRAVAEGGAPLAPREADALLASPVAREEYALHLRLARLRRVATAAARRGDEAANNDRHIFRAPHEERLAAAGGGDTGAAFRLVCGDAELWVVPGRTAETRFLLKVRLSPGMEGGAAERLVEVREDGPGGLLWMAGRTGADGTVHQFWSHEGTAPHERRGVASLRLFMLD